jgi:hypothetical protein
MFEIGFKEWYQKFPKGKITIDLYFNDEQHKFELILDVMLGNILWSETTSKPKPVIGMMKTVPKQSNLGK